MASQFTAEHIEIIKHVTCRIKTPFKTGTAVLFRVKGQNFVFLLTAKHCLTGDNSNQSVSINQINVFIANPAADDEYSSFCLPENSIILFPRKNVDIALILVNQPMEYDVPELDLLSSKYTTGDCIFRGFPRSYGSEKGINIFPVNYQETNIVTTTVDLTTLDSDPLYNCQGFSGSGVFCEENSKLLLMGILWQFEEPFKRFSVIDLSDLDDLLNDNGYHFDLFFEYESKTLIRITPDTLYSAKIAAEAELMELRTLKQNDKEKFFKLVNEKSLLGLLPQWQHLYMEEFGAFRRKKKENEILSCIETKFQKLLKSNHGLILHIISGDSGCGKSTLAKQVIQRLIENNDLNEFPNLQKVRLRLKIFELNNQFDWSDLEKDIKVIFRQKSVDQIFLIYFDDLFALDEKDVDQLLTVINAAAEHSLIYLITSSPSWIFDSGRDLPQKKIRFKLIECTETKIEGVDVDDIKALKEQYLSIYTDDCRPELLAELENEGEVLILLKLGLHQNLSYSQYFDQLLERLLKNQPRYLAALLLFSTLSRFYVHFPISLLQEFNAELDNVDKLPEDLNDYDEINDSGLRLFRIRRGNLESQNSQGIPDTIAPFHDRIAQVIYTTWGSTKNVPIFAINLVELRNKVYKKLNESSTTKPILANVFRGHLRVANEPDLQRFIKAFGPVQNGTWVLLDEPLAAYRWIIVSKYNFDRNKHLIDIWAACLSKIFLESRDIRAYFTLQILNPSDVEHLTNTEFLKQITLLGKDYFQILRGVLEQLLRQTPLPEESLGAFLPALTTWINTYPDNYSTPKLSKRLIFISLIASIASNIFGKSRQGEKINNGLCIILKDYLLNIEDDHIMNSVHGHMGILGLVKRVSWQNNDATELQNSLMNYLYQDRDTSISPIIFEFFLFFSRLSHFTETKYLFDEFIKTCEYNSSFAGLTYTSKEFWHYLKSFAKDNRSDYRKLIQYILTELINDKLMKFRSTQAYPDFISEFIAEVAFQKHKGSYSILSSLLKPLVEVNGDSVQTVYVFEEAMKLDDSFFGLLEGTRYDIYERQINLCFASKLKTSPEQVLQEFLELVINGQIIIASSIAPLLTKYLNRFDTESVDPDLLKEFIKGFYAWLRANNETRNASFFFTLINSKLLFCPDECANLELLAASNIRLMPGQLRPIFMPYTYLKWRLSVDQLDLGNIHNKTILLDTFWKNCIMNSHFEYNGSFIVYEKIFLFLLSNYTLERDEEWWGNAFGELLRYYVSIKKYHPNQYTPQNIIMPNRRKEVIYNKQSQCIEKMIETFLRQIVIQPYNKMLRFREAVDKTFKLYIDEPCMVKWSQNSGIQSGFDRTGALISYLELPQTGSANFIDIRNRVSDWYSWVKSSDQDLIQEIKKIHNWLVRNPRTYSSIFLASELIGITKNDDNKELWGEVILKVVDTANFKNSSELARIYGEYLEEWGKVGVQQSDLALEKKGLEKVYNWYLENAKINSKEEITSYGLQNIFKHALIMNLNIDAKLAQDAFLEVTKAQIEYPTGGAISRHYFLWLLSQRSDFSITPFLEFVITNNYGNQSPYVFARMISALDEKNKVLDAKDLESCWQVLAFLIEFRLDIDGTTISAENYFRYLTKYHYSIIPDGQKLINQISDEFFKLLEQKIILGQYQSRMPYLVISFYPFWNGFILRDENMVNLWNEMLLKHPKEMEAFGKFSRILDVHLRDNKRDVLLHQFHKSLSKFSRENPDHPLSPKFLSILFTANVQDQRLANVLPQLIKHQIDLLDTAYAIERFFKHGASGFTKEFIVELEKSLLIEVQNHLKKKNAERCISSTLTFCAPETNVNEITGLLKKYIETGIRPEPGAENGFWKVFTSYKHYQVNSNYDIAQQKEILRNLLHTIRININKEPSARYFTAIIELWDADCIPADEVLLSLKSLVLEIPTNRWRRVTSVCEKIMEKFGGELMVTPFLSVRMINLTLKNEQQGLISLKQDIQRQT
jgi:ABC-type oligopeptide transport system ATPase subunit